ncbi:MAG: CinA family protein [Protaetiibacter sp.]
MSGLAARLVAELARRGERVAVAESLTGGLLASAFVDVPGASEVFSGGVVAYSTELKARLLGVDAALLASRGPVDGDVARQLAAGVRLRAALDGRRPADRALATTGVAGPDPQDGVAPGTVWLGYADAEGTDARALRLAGDRAAIRAAAVDAALALLAEHLGIPPAPPSSL